MAVKNLGINNQQFFDCLICHLLIKKLDSATLTHYENQLDDVKELPSLQTFLAYIERRFLSIQSFSTKNQIPVSFSKNQIGNEKNKLIVQAGKDPKQRLSLLNQKNCV